MNILLVGAGAVGQVYARHIQLAGARVAFYVRPKAAAALAAGMTLYPLKRGPERTPVELHADVFTELADVAAQTWDQVWLCVPANALDEAWLRSIAAAVGSAVIVALPPGTSSEERIRKAFPGSRVVPAMIGMIAYQAPLPGETVPRPGIAYLFPPGSPSGFGGQDGRAVAELLARGGCPAVENQKIGPASAFGSGLLMPNVAALEIAGWSLSRLRRGPWLAVAAEASRQAMRVTASLLGVRAPFFVFLLRGFTLRIAWKVVPWLLPIDLETYLRYHFTKVGEQTRQLLGEYLRDGEAQGLPTGAIAALAEKLAEAAALGEGDVILSRGKGCPAAPGADRLPIMPPGDPAFRFSVNQLDAQTIAVEYAGHMPEGGTHIGRTEALFRASAGSVGMLYTVPDFISFHRSQMQQHVSFFLKQSSKITGIAVLKPRAIVRFGAITVGMMSKIPIETFDDREEALRWLASLRKASRSA